jgi:hypothetical protein
MWKQSCEEKLQNITGPMMTEISNMFVHIEKEAK